MSGPKFPQPDEEDYDEDPEEDLVTDEWEDVDEVEDDNDEGDRTSEIDFTVPAVNQ